MTSSEPSPAVGGRREGGISLAGLGCFVAVVEAGNLSLAARELGISQPTVSVHISSLERACGTLLLHRRPRLSLTDAGRELLVRARLVLSRMEEFEGSVRDLQGLRRGRLSVGLSTPAHAMPLIAVFMTAHPQVTVTTQLGNTGNLLEALNACDIDVAVISLLETPADMACTLVAEQRLMACMRRDDAVAEMTFAQIAQGPLVLRERGSMTRAMLERMLAERGLTPRIRLEVGSREAVKEAVAAGIGISVLLDGELSADSRLATVPIAEGTAQGGVYAVALRESLDISAVRAFTALASAGLSVRSLAP